VLQTRIPAKESLIHTKTKDIFERSWSRYPFAVEMEGHESSRSKAIVVRASGCLILWFFPAILLYKDMPSHIGHILCITQYIKLFFALPLVFADVIGIWPQGDQLVFVERYVCVDKLSGYTLRSYLYLHTLSTFLVALLEVFYNIQMQNSRERSMLSGRNFGRLFSSRQNLEVAPCTSGDVRQQ
jgi:hypothetical protein